jgi:hypothetical protein
MAQIRQISEIKWKSKPPDFYYGFNPVGSQEYM